MDNKKIVPITRINKFFSEEDFKLELEMSREFIEGDGNFTIILYRVDRVKTEYDDLYGESTSNGLKYLPPIELKVMPFLDEPNNKSYNNNGSLRYLQDGNFTFSIYQAQLDELNVEINHGDYIGYPVTETEVRYFTVSDNRSKFYDNKHTIMGYKGATRDISCVPADSSDFKSI